MSDAATKEEVPAVRPPQDALTYEERVEIFNKIERGELDPNSEEVRTAIAKVHEFTPLTFAGAFLKDHFKDKQPAFHQDIVDVLMAYNRVAIAAPRGHAKSTVTSFAYVLHQALYQKKKSIVIISSSEDMAVRFLRRIRDELEYNAMLQWLFGPQKTDKWSETELRLANRVTIHAKGRGAQLRGLIDGASRPDLIVLDDIEDEELVRSELRRLDLEQWFNGTVLPTLEPKTGQVVIIGTILHESSLLNRTLDPKLYNDFATRRFSAITKDGETLWPERFSPEHITSIKENYISRDQLALFYMEYMNDPIPIEAANFRSEFFSFFEELPKDDPQLMFEIYIDLGGGSIRANADYTAIVVIAIDKHNNIFVHDYINKRFGADTKALLDHVFQMQAKHKATRVVFEKTVAMNMIQAMLEQEQKRRRAFFPVEYLTPPRGSGDRRGNMSDAKFQRIVALASPMKLGVIKFRRWMTELQEQLLAFPRASHDDVADALGYAFMHVQRRLHHRTNLDPLGNPVAQNEAYEPLYPELGV